MDLSTIRPKVAQLSFQVLNRSVHPELFQIQRTRKIERDCYTASLQITADGHVISWRHAGQTWCEVASSCHQAMPETGRLLELPLRDSRAGELSGDDGCRYRYKFELERVPAKMLWMIQKQLSESAERQGLLYIFNASGRIDIGGLSFIHVESRLKSLKIQAIHTFPDDLSLVKTESLFSVE